ncbi:MAG: hypothetical protein ABSG01_05470 [Anaerolineales bacterium]|jgi:hypothetical protein
MRPIKYALLLSIFLLASCSPAHPVSQITVISHPDGPLYVGDQVSFEVLVPSSSGDNKSSVEVSYAGHQLGSAPFAPYGIGGRSQATLWWVWNTRDLKPGTQTLTFTRLPENTTWTETITLHPANQVLPPEPQAHWASNTTACCNLYYITGTAAERDISLLSEEADQQSAAVSAQMNTTLSKRIDIFFISRVVGQGGFTLNAVYVSYLDDNYIGNDMPILLHHEFVHYYDSSLGGQYRPSMLEEGLAVYLTGGHFKPEPLGPRAAALLNLGWYIPLTTVANDFYNQQHDIAYLEAGSLIQYMVETYGWSAFNQFYRTIPQPNNEPVSDVMDTALHDHFGISFSDLENGYLSYLHSQSITTDIPTDLQLTVNFFDAVRHYQEILDPSAYFLTAWLPDGSVMRQQGIVADFLRHPEGWKNQLLESLLIRSQKELFSGDYKNAERTLKLTNWVMDIIAP